MRHKDGGLEVTNMLNRVSANVLLKSVIAAMAAAVILLLGVSAFDSWQRLGRVNRVLDVADASAYAFTAMHNMRTDRATTVRSLNDPKPMDSEIEQRLKSHRAAEMPALEAAVPLLERIEFADKATLLPELKRLVKSITALQAESWAALKKSKEERREQLGKEYMSDATALLETLDKLSTRLGGTVKLSDAYVDQMMTLKQLAWVVRNAGGDASLLVSNGINAGKVAPDAIQKYAGFVGATDRVWLALEDNAAGLALPAKLAQTIAAAKKAYFADEYTATRDRLLKAVIAGEKPELTANQWAPMTVSRLATVLAVAEGALEAAKEYAQEQRASAQRALAFQLGLLVVALGLATGGMLAISLRVIAPLRAIQDAMLKVAAGDLSAEVSYPGRRDEIGALASALGTFKQHAEEKTRIEAEQRERHMQAAARQQSIEGYIATFETHMRDALEGLGQAATQLRGTSDDMSRAADQSNHEVKAVAGAADDASSNVQTVAAASEELSASISEISRQVNTAATTAGRAVEETRQTDGTVQGLAETAARIGDVVKLISDIAGQTNLLALNATIEAARAGEAGKGFAVVASEVKSLANQTAKATEDISAQIAAIQNVTKDAVEAIKRIGGTIGEVSTIATSIAAAVEEQGAATQEITRNTQLAAKRTTDVSGHIAGVTAAADATGTAARGVEAAAGAVGQQAEGLRAQVNEFLGKIRAA
jgi:methyl-accepting chemotaxis protein